MNIFVVAAMCIFLIFCVLISDGVKDTDGKAKDIQDKPKSLCHGDLSLWRDVMSESSYRHTRLVTKTHD